MVTTQKTARVASKVDKMPRIPENTKIQKRTLLHSQISSPYAGKSSSKIVYISSKTPFMSAVRRVRQLLNKIAQREMQSELARQKKKRPNEKLAAASVIKTRDREAVIISATGKAIEKALSLALFLQDQNDTCVKIATSSADAIDDIVPRDDYFSRIKDDIKSGSEDGGVEISQDVEMKSGPLVASNDSGFSEVAQPFPETRIRRTSAIQVSITTK